MIERVRGYRLTLFGRSLLMVLAEVFANVLLWVISGILFGRHEETRSILGLSLLAWVRHLSVLPFN
jgi:nickel/cobalt transporter (NiCoT) family protein